MTRWHIKRGDILDHPADGLLCSANPSLNLSGGVGGAFALRYGPAMQVFLHDYLHSLSLRHIRPGDAVIAPSCGSPFKAIAHAVSIDVFYDTDVETIIRTYDAAIRGLAELRCCTIAAACLGCGYGRVTDDTFASIAELLQRMHYSGVTEITLVTTNAGLVDRLKPKLTTLNGG
jgi:O-acetyl-ADP-ribose deacetylase